MDMYKSNVLNSVFGIQRSEKFFDCSSPFHISFWNELFELEVYSLFKLFKLGQ